MTGLLLPLTSRTVVAIYRFPEEPKPKFRPTTYPNPLVIAQDWERLLVNNQALNRADLARKLGVTRSQVTQVLRMLSLAPEVQKLVLGLGNPINGKIIGAHTLRALTNLPPEQQEYIVQERIKRSQLRSRRLRARLTPVGD